MAVCELLSVGTEILLGDITNTNVQYLSQQMAQLGISILRHTTVGDNPARLEAVMREALVRSDIVLVTGGLGPTQDDITREICSEVCEAALKLDPDILADMQAYFCARGLAMPENNIRQAYVPEGATVFQNEFGTAPGLAIEKNKKCIILLPGPPREMRPMFASQGIAYLQKYTQGAIVSRTVRTIGIGESAMEQRVVRFLDGENPTVAPYAKSGEAYLRVTAHGASREEALELCAPVVAQLQQELGEWVYGVDVENIETVVVQALKESGKTLAVAESITGGYVAKRITDIPGASQVFACGVVSYSDAIKQNVLGVDADDITRYTAVSQQVAQDMAQQIRKIAGADIGIATTGYAGPATKDAPAGISYIALADDKQVVCKKIVTGKHADREYNRYVTASQALDLVRRYLNR